MATRSFICKVNSDGSVEGVYCHWDGYPDHHLPLLEGKYTTHGDVDDLLALGDLSTLGETPGKCEAFHRDRGEELSAPARHGTLKEFIEYASRSGAAYVYTFSDGKWEVH